MYDVVQIVVCSVINEESEAADKLSKNGEGFLYY